MKKGIIAAAVICLACAAEAQGAGLAGQLFQPAQKDTILEAAVSGNAAPKAQSRIGKEGFYREYGVVRYYKKGIPQKGFLKVGGETYYFDEKGNMAVGRVEIQGDSYSFGPTGAMETGFVASGSKKYYYSRKTGKKLFGFRKIGGYRYYLKKGSGAVASGFITRKGKDTEFQAYYDGDGHLQTGTFCVGNVEYKATERTGRIYSVRNLAEAICQRPELPTGCEITSWAMMVNYAGIPMDKIDAADSMPKSSDPDRGFVGSPYDSGGDGLIVFPDGLSSITREQLGSYVNMTGCSTEELRAKLWDQHLVLVWVTQLDGFTSHTVALTGYDQKEGLFFYNDPWTGEESEISSEYLDTVWSENDYRAMSY